VVGYLEAVRAAAAPEGALSPPETDYERGAPFATGSSSAGPPASDESALDAAGLAYHHLAAGSAIGSAVGESAASQTAAGEQQTRTSVAD